MAPDQKKAQKEQRTIVFVDESGFYLLPAAIRTWAPCGQTPELCYPLWDHLSVISGITMTGKLYTMIQETSLTGQDIVAFLRHLLSHIEGSLLIIWDGLPAHRSQEVKRFLSNGGTTRIHLERLPGYAPDLNPDEGIWHYLKYVELGNVCCRHLQELHLELRRAIARLRHKKNVILACIRQANLPDPV
jgi:transposase